MPSSRWLSRKIFPPGVRRQRLDAQQRPHPVHAGPPEVHAERLPGRRRLLQRPDGHHAGQEPPPADGLPQRVFPGAPRKVGGVTGVHRGGFLKVISVGIPTYASMKTGF